MTQSELVDSVRLMCGHITEKSDELPAENIITISDWILNKIGEYITVKRTRYITLEAIQPEGGYDVHEDCTRVKDVLTSGEVDDDLLDLGSYKVVNETSMADYYNWPSLWKIKMMRQWRGRKRFKWTFDPVNKKLKIDPNSSSDAGKKYYYLSIERSHWTLSKLPPEFNDLLIVGVSWKALEVVALHRSELGGMHRDGGKVTYPSTELKLFVDSKKDEFYRELRIRSKIYSR